MTRLRLIDVSAAGCPAVTTEVAAGQWVTLAHADPEALIAAVACDPAGGGAPDGRVLLGGADLSGQPTSQRVRAGLGICPGRLEDLPGMRVLDVVLLAPTEAARGLSWRAALGSRRARAGLADRETAARALCERMGIGGWIDAEAVGLPRRVAAATDLVRAVAGAPRALVWAVPPAEADPHTVPRPDEPAVSVLAAALAVEQARLGMAVLAVDPAASR